MVDLDHLKANGRWAYELGRLRVASRVALYLVPVGLFSIWTASDRETCGCLALLLLGITISARWRSGAGIRAVRAGLAAGSVVLGLAWGLAAANVLGTGWGAGALASASFVAALRASTGPQMAWVGLLVVALMASLGCVDLEPSAQCGIGLALGLGAAVERWVARLRL